MRTANPFHHGGAEARKTDADTGRAGRQQIRVIREAGGVGDVVRMIPALRGLREARPDANLWVFAPEEYRPLLAGGFDEYVPTPWRGRRPRDTPLDESRWPYLDVGVKFDRSIDLYCPAYRHEHSQRGDVWLDRINLFCRAAGVAPNDKTPKMRLSATETATARAFPETEGFVGARKLIALQPFSTDPARNWPAAHWMKLADGLEAAGHRVIVLDSCEGRTRGFAQKRVWGRSLGFVCALVAQCNLLVAPDSGFGHVAAAVGTPCVGLFASQSGGVMYRHYPLHTYLYPPWDDQAHCRWPCFWARPHRCQRAAMMRENRTCEMLARITVEAVMAAVEKALARGRDIPPPLSLPRMSPEARRVLDGCEEITETPIPRRDHCLDALALTHPVSDLSVPTKEAFRVLRPGGTLHTARAERPAWERIKREGFRPVASTHDRLWIWRKASNRWKDNHCGGAGRRVLSSASRTAR